MSRRKTGGIICAVLGVLSGAWLTAGCRPAEIANLDMLQPPEWIQGSWSDESSEFAWSFSASEATFQYGTQVVNLAEYAAYYEKVTVSDSSTSDLYLIELDEPGVSTVFRFEKLAETELQYTINGLGIVMYRITGPEILVTQGDSLIVNGGRYQFEVLNSAVAFTIRNTGREDLQIGPLAITGADASAFTLSPPSATLIRPSGTAIFRVAFNPTRSGQMHALLTLDCNDADEGSFSFTLAGDTTIVQPEMDVWQGSTAIPLNGSFAFARIGTPVTFTIENRGLGDLILLGSPRVVIRGTNASDFEVTQQPSLSVGPGRSTQFAVSFNPSELGIKEAEVSIWNNDSDEGDYCFQLAGTGVKIVAVGDTIDKMICDPSRPYVYAISRASGNLLFMNTAQMTIEKTVYLAPQITDLDIDVSGSLLYVISFSTNRIIPVDLSTQQPLAPILFPAPANHPDGSHYHLEAGRPGRLYFVDGAWAPVLHIIDVEEGAEIGTFDADGVGDIVASADGRTLYVWRQYGWSAGNLYANAKRIDASTDTLSVLEAGSINLNRDPLETPILLSADEKSLAVKSYVLQPGELNFVSSTYTGKIYAMTTDGQWIFTNDAMYQSGAAGPYAPLPLSSTIMAASPANNALYVYAAGTNRIAVIALP